MSYASKFFTAYVECALWSSTGENDVPLDRDFTADDIEISTHVRMLEECNVFVQCAEVASLLTGIDAEQAGHDFWLSRNGHGAGFWDRGLGEIGEKLTKLAHQAGSRTLYVGHDRLIYQF